MSDQGSNPASKRFQPARQVFVTAGYSDKDGQPVLIPLSLDRVRRTVSMAKQVVRILRAFAACPRDDTPVSLSVHLHVHELENLLSEEWDDPSDPLSSTTWSADYNEATKVAVCELDSAIGDASRWFGQYPLGIEGRLPAFPVEILERVSSATDALAAAGGDLERVWSLQSGTGRKASTKQKRLRRSPAKVRPLTAKETEALHLFAEHKGNYAAAARAAGKSRAAIRKLCRKAHKKLGISMAKARVKTQALPIDRRGQVNLTDRDEG